MRSVVPGAHARPGGTLMQSGDCVKSAFAPLLSRKLSFCWRDSMSNTNNIFRRMLRTLEILARLGVSESHLRRLERDGQCPVRRCLGPRARGLPEDVLDSWLMWCLHLCPTTGRLPDPFRLPRWPTDLVQTSPVRGIQMLTLREVEQLVGLRSTCIYGLIAAGAFPRPAPLGSWVRRWALHEIEAWLESPGDYQAEPCREDVHGARVKLNREFTSCRRSSTGASAQPSCSRYLRPWCARGCQVVAFAPSSSRLRSSSRRVTRPRLGVSSA